MYESIKVKLVKVSNNGEKTVWLNLRKIQTVQNYVLLMNTHTHDGGSLVTKSSLTLVTPPHCSLPGSSVHGISHARILEWVAISFSSIHT